MKIFYLAICTTLFLLSAHFLNGQEAEIQEQKESNFNKYEAFSPLFMNEYTNSFHSATGKPGPNYWQNKPVYDIKATLDTIRQEITGEVTITYINNSPHALEYLWLQLDQNTFRMDSRGSSLYPSHDRNGVRYHTEGYRIQDVVIGKNPVEYKIDDTRMQIRLPKTLKPNGKKVKFTISYSFEIPTHGKDRMGRVETRNGTIYTLAQWHPRMSVFDEVEGWNTLPYLGTGEFYLEYGDYNYEVTVPENMIVVGSGVLKNQGQVLTSEMKKRLKKAADSDETVTILSAEEMKAGTHHAKGKDGMLTWKFSMKNTRDVAWAAAAAFIWDAAKMNLPNGEKGLAQSVYPEENAGMDGYGRSTEYTKNAVEIYSKDWFPYPYKVATNVGGHELGMEYPGIVFCSYKSQGKDLWGVINHEFGHTWFPMIVGSNERKYAWMDEGLNTFINDLADEQFNFGEYASGYHFPGMGTYVFDEDLNPLFTRPDVIHNQQNLGVEAYYKPAIALHVLRNAVLGKDRFDYALRQYINDWKYKHPQPWDFFNAMNNAAGEDLSWFFKSWFMENWTFDQGIENIVYIDNSERNGAEITLRNYGEIPMPVTLKINLEDNQSKTVELPVEIWMTGDTYVYHSNTTTKIISVEIDPHDYLPDADLSDNSMKKLVPAPEGLSANTIIEQYLKAIGGRDRLENLEDILTIKTSSIQGATITVTEAKKGKYNYHYDVDVDGMELLKINITENDVVYYHQGEKMEISEEQKEEIRQEDQVMFPETQYFQEDYRLSLLGIEEQGKERTYVVQVTDPKGNSELNYFDISTGLLLKKEDPQGNEETFSDYKNVNGIMLPFTMTGNIFGIDGVLKTTKAEVESGLDEEFFEK